MPRTTKASNAVLRLQQRSNNTAYSMVSTANSLFYLALNISADKTEKLCAPLEMDAFVHFVNNINKTAPRKPSKLDTQFEAKLKHSSKTKPE
ncbi:MAG: hypothetical protein K2P84_04535 [Undibacterium sp.]|nr:hypothetical protein [Undibacterium sp.]